jgi:type II secretory pathway pseudopilin PulG
MFKFCDTKILKYRGFTVLEVIIAIFVITVGIVGILGLVTWTISSSTYSSDKLVAAYLAQEGIEIVRNIRDTNWLEGAANWDDGFTVGNYYEVDYDDPDLVNCPLPCDYGSSGTNLDFLKINSGFYNYSLGSDTKFKRRITISNGPIVESFNVEVGVFWEHRDKIYNVKVQEDFYNWYQ